MGKVLGDVGWGDENDLCIADLNVRGWLWNDRLKVQDAWSNEQRGCCCSLIS